MRHLSDSIQKPPIVNAAGGARANTPTSRKWAPITNEATNRTLIASAGLMVKRWTHAEGAAWGPFRRRAAPRRNRPPGGQQAKGAAWGPSLFFEQIQTFGHGVVALI